MFTTECPLFETGHSTQTVHSPPKPMRKWHIFGMSTSLQNDSCHLKLCCLSCTLSYTGSLVTSVEVTHPNTASGGSFWNLQTPMQKFKNFLGHTLRHTDSCLFFFRHGQKPVQNKCPKGRIVLATEKDMFWRRLMEVPG